jgi:hypothetical protein
MSINGKMEGGVGVGVGSVVMHFTRAYIVILKNGVNNQNSFPIL